MKKRLWPTLMMFGILAALAVWTFVFDKGPAKKEGEEAKKEITIQKLDCRKLDQIEIEAAYDRLALRKSGKAWRIAEPYKARTAKYSMDTVADSLCDVKAEGEINIKPEDLSQFGLDAPEKTVRATLKDGTARVLVFGAKTPVGEQRYVSTGKKDAVYIVADSLYSSFDKSAEDFRDKSISQEFDQDAVARIALRRKDSEIVCEKKTVKAKKKKPEKTKKKVKAADIEEPPVVVWQLKGRKGAICDAEAGDLLSLLGYSEAVGFEDEPPADLSGLGFGGESGTELELGFSDGKKMLFDMGGQASDGFYLMNRQRKEIYIVDAELNDKIVALKKTAAKLK